MGSEMCIRDSIKVFMSRSSLYMLTDICSHPEFGSHIVSIDLASQWLLNIAGNEHIFLPRFGSQYDISQSRHYASGYSKRYQEQRSLIASGEAVHVLTTALKALKPHGRHINLGMSDNVWDAPDEGALGLHDFGRICFKNTRIWKHWCCARTVTLKILLTAAYHSDCPLEQLQIKIETPTIMSRYGRSQETLEGGGIDLAYTFDLDLLATVCRKLRSFSLELLQSSHDWRGANPDSIVLILTLAVNLKILHVDVGSATYDHFAHLDDGSHWEELESIAMAITSNQLEEIHLVNCIIPEHELIDLLKRNRSTLRVLDLHNCCINWRGTWGSFFSKVLENNTELKSLRVEDLYNEQHIADGVNHTAFTTSYTIAGVREYGPSDNLKDDIDGFVTELTSSGF